MSTSYDFFKFNEKELMTNNIKKMKKPEAEVEKINSKGIPYSI